MIIRATTAIQIALPAQGQTRHSARAAGLGATSPMREAKPAASASADRTTRDRRQTASPNVKTRTATHADMSTINRSVCSV
jgi:hypothetical protein